MSDEAGKETGSSTTDETERRLDYRAVAHGATGFLVAALYTVVAAVASLVPPDPVVGPSFNLAAWIGLVVAGLLAAVWLGFDVGRGAISIRRLATFVVTAWVLWLPLGAVVEGVVAPLVDAGPLGVYLGRLVVFGVATAGAAWMAYGGGWERARSRMRSGGLDEM